MRKNPTNKWKQLPSKVGPFIMHLPVSVTLIERYCFSTNSSEISFPSPSMTLLWGSLHATLVFYMKNDPGRQSWYFEKKNASCNQPSWCTNVSAPSTWWGKPSTTKNQRSKKKIQRKIWPFTKWKWISRGDRQLICKFYLETELQSRNVWTNSNLLQKTWALKRTKKITSFATKQETKTEDDKMFSFSQSIFCRKIAERKSIERHFLYELGSEAIRPSMIYAILFLLADLRKRIIQIWEKSKRSVLKKNDVRKTNWSKMTTPE